MVDSDNNNIIYFPEPGHPKYHDAGITVGCGDGFFWNSVTPNIIEQKRGQAKAAIDADMKQFKDGQRSWQYAMVFYRTHDIVTLERFLSDFDLYSAATLGPKTHRERALNTIGFSKPKEIGQKNEVVERHNLVIEIIRKAATAKTAFIHHGHEYIEDLSCGETRFHFVFLDIAKLFSWVVNESGIDESWIPYPIKIYVHDNISNAEHKGKQKMQLQYDDVWSILDIDSSLQGEVEAAISPFPDIFTWIKSELASCQSLVGCEDTEVVKHCDNRSRSQEGLHKGCYFYATTVQGSTCERYPIKTIAEFIVFFTKQQYPPYGRTGLVFSTNDLLLYLLRIFRAMAFLRILVPSYTPDSNRVLGNAFSWFYKTKVLDPLPEVYADLPFDISGVWADLLTKAVTDNYINKGQILLKLKGEVFLSENNTPSPPSTNDPKSQNREESLTQPAEIIDLKNGEKVIITPEPQKRRAGRPRSSPEKKAKEMLLYQGWTQFRESRVGGVKEYVEDLNSKGESYTAEEMKRLINRCGKNAKKQRFNSE